MDIKPYIDQLHEIKALSRGEQFLLLELAYKEESKKSFMFKLSLLPLMIPLLFIGVVSGGSYYLFGYSLWLFFISVIISLLLSRVAVTEIHSYFLQKGVKIVLKRKNEESKSVHPLTNKNA